MAYISKRGRRPDEAASKSSHSHVINDPAVAGFLVQCKMPKRSSDIEIPQPLIHPVVTPSSNPIKHIVAVDGGFTEVVVQTDFPSATVAFFQFGALIFSTSDLENLEEQPFIDPKDMAKLRNIHRLKLSLPIRNISYKDEATLTHSVRRSLYDFFMQDIDGRPLMDALSWLIFERYRGPSANVEWLLSSCPHCDATGANLSSKTAAKAHTFICQNCGGTIYLTDVFRLHEAIDDEMGAGGILGYVTTALEQIVLAWVIKFLLDKRPGSLREVCFIKDGPLAFFGQTANIHKPMRKLVNYLFEHHDLYLAGLEKSGAFVEHADEITQRLERGTYLLPDNDYIYQHILPGKADASNPYGRTTYYGSKLIYKAANAGTYVVSIPNKEVLVRPRSSDLKNLDVILHNLQHLKCDMYDSSLLPIALVNKLVSLADHPSANLLKAFATKSITIY